MISHERAARTPLGAGQAGLPRGRLDGEALDDLLDPPSASILRAAMRPT
jgi:hypothetical protein